MGSYQHELFKEALRYIHGLLRRRGKYYTRTYDNFFKRSSFEQSSFICVRLHSGL